MKVLYLTFFEPVLQNGIYETQVKQLLYQLKAEHGRDLTISHCAILPAVEVGRKGLVSPLVTERRELAELKKDFSKGGISAKFSFLPVILPKRWGSELPLPVLVLVLTLSLPVLLYRVARERPEIIHCRSYGATLVAMLARFAFRDLKVVFDPRGFWPEEGVVTGRWKEHSLRFRFWQRVEKHLLRKSDKVVALSEPFARRISAAVKDADCEVIYTSADVERFQLARESRGQKKDALRLTGKTVFVYNGSLHAWHDPLLLAGLYKVIAGSLADTKLLVITGHDKYKLQAAFASAGLRPEEFVIVASRPSEVPGYLATADYGLVPLKEIHVPSPMSVVADTMIGTKVAEYLACGLPIIVNKNVGGLRALMDRHKIGILFDSERLNEIAPGIRFMNEHYDQYRQECELVATRYFSLQQSARSYYQLYQQILVGAGTQDGKLETANI